MKPTAIDQDHEFDRIPVSLLIHSVDTTSKMQEVHAQFTFPDIEAMVNLVPHLLPMEVFNFIRRGHDHFDIHRFEILYGLISYKCYIKPDIVSEEVPEPSIMITRSDREEDERLLDEDPL